MTEKEKEYNETIMYAMKRYYARVKEGKEEQKKDRIKAMINKRWRKKKC